MPKQRRSNLTTATNTRYTPVRTISPDVVDVATDNNNNSDNNSNSNNNSKLSLLIAQDKSQAACDEAMLCCRVLLLCISWYTVSSANNIIGKRLLMYYPYPLTATMAQLLATAVFSTPLTLHWRIPSAEWHKIGWHYSLCYIIPLGFGKFVAAASAHVSLWRVPVSYAHTVKASMPIFVVFLSRVLLHEKQTWLVYFSLTLIVTGVIVATITELSFDSVGLASALLATLAFSLQNVFSKKCLRETGMHHIRLLSILAQMATIMLLPIWLLTDVRHVMHNWQQMNNDNSYASDNSNIDWQYVCVLLGLDGFLNFAQNVIAFTMIALVSPLSYAVANASKRIAVILMSLIVLQNPVTLTNCAGMSLAIIGVLIYNKAKYDQNRELYRQRVLPYVKSEANLLSNLTPQFRNNSCSAVQLCDLDNDSDHHHHHHHNAYYYKSSDRVV